MVVKKFPRARDRKVIHFRELDEYKTSITGMNFECKPDLNGYDITVDKIDYESAQILTGEITNHLGPTSTKKPELKIMKPRQSSFSKSVEKSIYLPVTFIEFANLNYNEDEIKNFANKYGLLGLWEDQEEPEMYNDFLKDLTPHPYRYQKYKERFVKLNQSKPSHKNELLLHWYFEIFHMKRVVKMWSRCWTKDVDKTWTKDVDKIKGKLEVKKGLISREDPEGEDWEIKQGWEEYKELQGEYLGWRIYDDTTQEESDAGQEWVSIEKYWKVPDEEGCEMGSDNVKKNPLYGLDLEKYLVTTTNSEELTGDETFENITPFFASNEYTANDFRRDYLDQITTIINKFIAGRVELASMAPYLPSTRLKNYEKKLTNLTIEAGKKFGDFLDKDLKDGIKKLKPEEEEIYLPKIQLAWKPNNLIGALWKSCLSFFEAQSRIEFCKECNKFFHQKRTQQMFCSDTCRGKNFQKNKKNIKPKGGKK